MNTLEALQWRYATKQFDATKKLSEEQLNTLTEALRLAPSSFGLQPWKFLVISNPEVRTKLREAAWGQPQVTDASHLIVLAAKTDLSTKSAEEFVATVAKTRNIEVSALQGLHDMIAGSIENRSPEERIEWAARQAYIALGTLLTAAAIEQIDAAPMEGFDPQKFDEILGLAEKNLTSVVIAGVGFRSAEDGMSHAEKVRFPAEEVIIKIA